MSKVTMYLPDNIRVSYLSDKSVEEVKKEISDVFSNDDELVGIWKEEDVIIVPKRKILTITVKKEQSDVE